MGFEAIHQPKSSSVLIPWLLLLSSFRINPWLVFFFLAHPSPLLPIAGKGIKIDSRKALL
jgi:hypothetical protein